MKNDISYTQCNCCGQKAGFYDGKWHCRKCGMLSQDQVSRVEKKFAKLDFFIGNTGGVRQ